MAGATIRWQKKVVTILQDLFVAVAIGVVVTALAFVWEVGERIAVSEKMVNGRKVYTVHGPLFFASTQTFIKLFDPFLTCVSKTSERVFPGVNWITRQKPCRITGIIKKSNFRPET